MTQKILPMKGVKPGGRRVLSGAAGVVALHRTEGGEIVLRFLDASAEWGDRIREVKIDCDLAEQLQRLLVDELELERWT